MRVNKLKHHEKSCKQKSSVYAWYAVGVGEPFSCDDIQSVYDEVIDEDTFIPACSIQLQDVSVTNGSKLTLDVVHDTFIFGPFEVESNSEIEIK